MDRETALQNYKETVSEMILAFRIRMSDYIMEHAEDLEALVEEAMKLLGEQMAKQGKEYVCFMYFSLLKADLIHRNYRIHLHGLDISWYMDNEPVEVYVDVKELFKPFDEFWNDLTRTNQGYGVFVNDYDIRNLLIDELAVIDNMICQILRYRLREGEKKGIFDPVPRSPYWIVRWGEYRDQSEILLQTDRVEKESGVWKEKLSKAARKPDALVFSYWYKGTYENRTIQDLDMRFITFEDSVIQSIVFKNCNLEGSRFPGSRFVGCSFEGCNLWGADFRDCTFEQTSFAGAELTAAVFPADSVPFLNISAEQLQVIRLDREEET